LGIFNPQSAALVNNGECRETQDRWVFSSPRQRIVRGFAMQTRFEIGEKEKEKLFSSVLRLHAKAVGLGLGLFLGLVIFVATNWLVIKGGEPVGPHLALLSQYFIGYRVSFLGSLIGFVYGFVLGTLSGALMSWIYNTTVRLRTHYHI
jgi:hypothetical protein